MLDIRSIPARLADPERRAEPWSVVHNVGGGDYRSVGDATLAMLVQHAGLQQDAWVLDIGCGTGRVASRLQDYLKAKGRYIGFDISRAAIRSCQRRFRSDGRLRFEHADIWNGDYNRGGRVSDIEATFPAETGAFDLAFATSVFTHMQLPAVRRYTAEAGRSLKPGGRFAFTAFTLEPGRVSSAEFPFEAFGTHSAVVDQRSPERAIAHRRDAIERAIEGAGMAVEHYLRGSWNGPAEYYGAQDLWVARRGGTAA
jgi:SAM-dependent methyltransferase